MVGSSPGLVHVGKWTPSLTAWPLVSLWCPGVLLDSSGWLRICNFPAPASQVLGLQVCPTTPSACFVSMTTGPGYSRVTSMKYENLPNRFGIFHFCKVLFSETLVIKCVYLKVQDINVPSRNMWGRTSI